MSSQETDRELAEKKLVLQASVPGWLELFLWAAGLMDACTGVLLVVAPMATLDLMRIPAAESDASLIRFIGTFVFGVGLIYLLPFLESARLGPLRQRIVDALRMTAWVRLAVATYLAFSLFSGTLPKGWITVLATDLLLAAFQFWLTARHERW